MWNSIRWFGRPKEKTEKREKRRSGTFVQNVHCSAREKLFSYSNGAILMLMLTGSAILIATDDNTGLIFRYLILIFISVGLSAWLDSRVLLKRRRSHVLNGKSN